MLHFDIKNHIALKFNITGIVAFALNKLSFYVAIVVFAGDELFLNLTIDFDRFGRIVLMLVLHFRICINFDWVCRIGIQRDSTIMLCVSLYY